MAAKHKLICGLDEAGRGALAGPVVAAAVVLRARHNLKGLADSKILPAAERERLAKEIMERAEAWAVAEASPDEICRINILQASLLAMRRAFEALGLHADSTLSVIADGLYYPLGLPVGCAQVKADALVPAVSAAGILAKVHRDGLMRQEVHPQFAFGRHKGYPTPQHLQELAQHGPLPVHRRTFAPVRALLQTELEL
jgi:ribonuclease HII